MPNDEEWQSDTEEAKQKKRDAANKFLEATINDQSLREAVKAYPAYAREMFQKIGGITLPEYVEIICMEPDRRERNKLVVFVLPKETSATGEYWRDGWIASWDPY